ncbi:MAG: hypothetical protein JW981_07810 [Anaerolineae bacterium]|nr:hypothetical protein [Anaerolineae bacterium]
MSRSVLRVLVRVGMVVGVVVGLCACEGMPTPSHEGATTPTPIPGILYVDAGNDLGTVNPLVYGTNTGPWQGLTRSKMPYIEAAGLTLLRFPGGNWGDEYLLGESQLDEFMELAHSLGAEPLVQVKLYKATPKQAAKWVEYANLTQEYGIKYWSIGNEPSLYESNRGLAGYDTETFNQQWREFALAMKAVDPDILLVGPDIHQYTSKSWENPKDTQGKDWMREFLVANGDLVDVVAFHRYPFGQYDPTPKELLESRQEWDTIIPELRTLIVETTGRELPVAVTEVNSNWSSRKGKDATPDSFVNAVWWADVLGRLIQQRVSMVAHFALEGAGGLGMLAYPDPRPTYYVYMLYQEFGTELLYTASGDTGVSVYAARRDDEALSIIVVNVQTEEIRIPLRLDNFEPGGPAEVWRLDSAHMAENIGAEEVSNGAELILPPQSVTLYVLP